MNKFLGIGVCLWALCVAALGANEFVPDLARGKEMAAADQKMMFVFYGREKCGICQATKAMIKAKEIRLPESKFVLVDLNCDDQTVSAAFHKDYSGQTFGKTLPFVVIADSTGKALASTSGYQDSRAWAQVLKTASKTATTAGGSATGSPAKSGDANWPFKSAPKTTR